jgi:hypothetical protein
VLLSAPAEKGKISVVLGGSGTSATNAGLIDAASVELKANGGDVFALAVNRDGGVDATGIKSDGGRVFLIAEDGQLTAKGEIDAPGGFVETSGASVDFTGLKVVAANWLIDPITLTVDQAAADTISTDLASAGITLKTAIASASGPGNQSPGAGDIIIDAPISWSSANAFNLDAYHGIQINAPIVASGAGKVTITTNDGGTGGDYTGSKGGRISFTGTPGTGQALTINGTAFTLLYTPADIVAVNSDLTGHYALATSIDFDTTTTLGVDATVYGAAPIAPLASSPFTGVFEGLGNSLTNLRVIDVTPVQQAVDGGFTNGRVGLFGSVGAGGVVRDLLLVAPDMHGVDGMQVGTVAGALSGTLLDVHVFDDGNGDFTAKVGDSVALGGGSSFIVANVGGLAGASNGVIINSSSTSGVVGGGDANAGGLVGYLYGGGSISGSFADNEVDVGSFPAGGTSIRGGGLVGFALGLDTGGASDPVSITNSYATGNVNGGGGVWLGGLAGALNNATVSTSYATGFIQASSPGQNNQSNLVGGFAGIVVNGSVIDTSWSGGAVSTAGGTPSAPSLAGGFAGIVALSSQVSDSYSLSSVASLNGVTLKAGFASVISTSSSVDGVYASGSLNGGGFGLAGVVGASSGTDTSGSLTNSYWDVTTTGAVTGYQTLGTGQATNDTGVSGTAAYASATYGNFDLVNTWYMVDGETRPILRSEHSTTITDAHQLQLMALDLSANYTLANDIDASETGDLSGVGVWNPANGFVPVGQSDTTPFAGQLDGQNHAITSLTIKAPQGAKTVVYGSLPNDGAAGLFGFVGPTGNIHDLVIGGSDSSAFAQVTAADGMVVGILAGAFLGQVNNVAVIGQVTAGSSDATNAAGTAIALGGGLVGFSDGQINNALAAGGVVAGNDAFAGGLVGADYAFQQASSITNSRAIGAVFIGAGSSSGASAAGGLVAILDGVGFTATISGSWANVQVHGASDAIIGGFAGEVTQAQVDTSYAIGPVSFTNGAASVEDVAGGFAGIVNTGGTVTQSWSSGSVTAPGGSDSSSIIGGFAGLVSGSVTQSYTTSPVTISSAGSSTLGGFAGESTGTVDQVYATGPETIGSGTQQGGLVTLNFGTLTNSYWDQGTTGASVAYLTNFGTATNLNSVSGSAAYDPASYGNFNLNTDWFMIAGETRPFLRAEHSTTITNAHQLQLMAMDPTASYKLGANFDAGETSRAWGVWNPANGFVPIGGNGQPAFSGTFNGQFINGQNGVISGLTIIDTTKFSQTSGVVTNGVVGLFGWSTGTLENVNLTGASVTGGDGMRVGILAGSQSSLVQNVQTDGSVTVGNKVSDPVSGGFIIAGAGGLVGVSGGTILNSSSNASVTGGDAYVGGLAGSLLSGGAVTGASATGAVVVGGDLGFAISPPIAGGLIGATAPGSSVTNSNAEGDVTGGAGSVLGGFAGVINGSVSFSFASGNTTQSAGGVNGQADIAGGFAGQISGTVSRSGTNGNVTTVGGPNSGLPTLAGGFAGEIVGGQVTDAYSSPVITISGSAFSDAGGFAGMIDTGGSATNTGEGFGSITSGGTKGGLVGAFGAGGGSLTDSYFDAGALGSLNVVGAGSGTVTHSSGFGGSTGLDPHDPNTFVGWDFTNVWAPPDANNPPGLYGVSHELRVSFDNFSMTYGSFPTYHVSFYGFQYGDTLPTVNFDSGGGGGNQGILFGGATTSSSGYFNVGTFDLSFLTPTASDSTDVFRVIQPNVLGTMTVTPRLLTVGLIGATQKTYDGGIAAALTAGNFGALSGSIVPGDSVSVDTTQASGSYASKNVGVNLVVSATGLIFTGADAGDYALQNNAASGAIGTITPATLVISAVSATKTYDGATSSSAAPQVTGLVGGDTVSSLNESYDSKNVGQRTLSVNSGFAVNDGNGGNNYNLTVNSASGSITAASLTVTLTGTVQKTYDGGTGATLGSSNYLLSGMISGDSVSLNDPTSGTYDTKNAGTGKAVNVTGLALSGADAGNYAVSASVSGAVGTINPKTLSASLTGTVEKTFDGTTAATLTGANYLLAGQVSGDSVNLNDPTSGIYDTASPGSGKTVTVNGLQLQGSDASNYTVNSQAFGPVGVITQAEQTFSKDDPQVTVGTQASNIVADNIETVSSEALASVSGDTSGAAAGAEAGGGAGKSRAGIISVFPVGEGPANERAASDTSPVLGGGNSDLWSGGGEEPPIECPVGPNGKASCEARP